MEMGKGLWIFELERTKEAQRILRDGTRKLEGFSISLKKWSKETGCNIGRDGDKWQPPLKDYHKRKGSKAQALILHSLDDKEHRLDLI